MRNRRTEGVCKHLVAQVQGLSRSPAGMGGPNWSRLAAAAHGRGFGGTQLAARCGRVDFLCLTFPTVPRRDILPPATCRLFCWSPARWELAGAAPAWGQGPRAGGWHCQWDASSPCAPRLAIVAGFGSIALLPECDRELCPLVPVAAGKLRSPAAAVGHRWLLWS